MSVVVEDSIVASEESLDFSQYATLLDVFQKSCRQYADRVAFSNLGFSLTYKALEEASDHFASYLQHELKLMPGDRIAIQMPNVLQYPVCVFGALRAGLIVVNTNPLYTAREMVHQFNDSGAKALVALSTFGDRVEEALPKTSVEHVIITEVADMLPAMKRFVVNKAVKHVKKMVPDYRLPQAVSFLKALTVGRRKACKVVALKPEDTAVLQYTGGTTGVSKGAELTHRNLVANMLQIRAFLDEISDDSVVETVITPLPLYHIFSFTVNCMAVIESGNHSVLITNPRDIPAFISELKKWSFSAFTGLNTLFVALYNHPDFGAIDFSKLKLTMAGGMALQSAVADKWQSITGSPICEGFGMTETSPVVCVNPIGAIQLGTVGVPVPGTSVKVIDAEGQNLPIGERGELCVKGPQVMKGYWQRADATAKTMTEDGWLKTGDIAVLQKDGYVKIVDRLKDMILVSGFNVYPNEVEDELCTHPGVVECAAVGVQDEKSGETVKLFVVKSQNDLSEQDIIEYAKSRLTGYKVPKYVEFRTELPKSNVGKILRKELRA